jgi:hypothetical protein
MTTIWGDDERFVKTYFSDFGSKLAYSTFDWATRTATAITSCWAAPDDVINVAGHRIGTREIEEAVQAHCRHRRSRRRGRRGSAQGTDAGRVRRRQGCVDGREP